VAARNKEVPDRFTTCFTRLTLLLALLLALLDAERAQQEQPDRAPLVAQFTCFTGTTVQILTGGARD
jgi:hypothetical protein